MDESLAGGRGTADETAYYGVIRSSPKRKWWGWPVEIDFATVSGDGTIQLANLIVRPSPEWLRYRHPPIEAEASDTEYFRHAVDAQTAAIALNDAFGHASVYCPDVRCDVGRLYDEARLARTWKFTNFFIPFEEYDFPVGKHAVLRLVDRVPGTLQGQARVEAHAQAYLDLCRAYRLVSVACDGKATR